MVNGGNIAGVALGILIGVTSGIVALVLLKTANKVKVKDVSSIVTLTSEILAIATFWCGTPWVPTKLIPLVSLAGMINPYIISVAITFTLIVAYPIFRWIIRLGAELGQIGATRNA